MLNEFSRTELLFGSAAMERLKNASVIIFGIGGVGSFTAEALARSGIGKLILVDHDRVSLTNLNRQLIATHDTIGRLKVEVMKERILSINPAAQVDARAEFLLPEMVDQFPLKECDYIVDAIDTVAAKLILAQKAEEYGVPSISCMGAGNKLDPFRFEVADIYQTSVCPLARVMRRELKARGVRHLKVLYSKEPPLKPFVSADEETSKRQTPGSVSFVPSAAGLMAAGEVIRDLIGESRMTAPKQP